MFLSTLQNKSLIKKVLIIPVIFAAEERDTEFVYK